MFVLFLRVFGFVGWGFGFVFLRRGGEREGRWRGGYCLVGGRFFLRVIRIVGLG